MGATGRESSSYSMAMAMNNNGLCIAIDSASVIEMVFGVLMS